MRHLRDRAPGREDVTPEHLAAAVRLVGTGDALPAPQLTRRLVERYAADTERAPEWVPADLAALTPRARGAGPAGPRNVQHRTGGRALSEATVESHVARILAKLGLRDRAQAVVLAYESSLVRPGTRRARAASRTVRGRAGE
nr:MULTISPECIES: LuxR C-terminal-related transcriptional regulator [unclassified Streptomyces]